MLPGIRLPEDMIFTTDDKEAVTGKDVLVMAVASAYTRATAKELSPLIAPGQIIVNVAKGVEDHTYMTLSEIIEQEIPQAEVAVLSGPSHAEEVSRGIPTTIVVGERRSGKRRNIYRISSSVMCSACIPAPTCWAWSSAEP